MDQVEYIVKEINELYQLPIRVMDLESKTFTVPKQMFYGMDPVCNNPMLCDSILLNQRNSLSNGCIYQEEDYIYSSIEWRNHIMILGPVTVEKKTASQKTDYLRKNKVSEASLMIPQMNVSYLKKVTSFAYGIISGDYDSKESLFEDNQKQKEMEEAIHQELTQYQLSTSEEEQVHFSFLEEKKQAEHIIHGDLRSHIKKNDETTNVFANKFVGKMAYTQIKQTEYECVCWITLMTRYAIEAGVTDANSYALSDVTLQKLSIAKTTMEMEQIFDRSMKEFDTLIKEAKSAKVKRSPYVDECKDYITKHIYERFTLEDLAKEVGVHPVYLSRLFSECIGMPITTYIMQEKIKIACNLLKYSEKSIATIAEYMNLAPQSYFSRVFKKVMKQTPLQYRNSHMAKKFYES